MKKLFFISAALLVLFSCGTNGVRESKDYLSAFIKAHEDVLLFGKADINSVLNKADYKNVPKFGAIVADQLKTIEKGINIQTPIFFAVEVNSFEPSSKPVIYAFIDLKNCDSTVAELTKMGQDMQKTGDLNYFQDADVIVGIQNNLAILVVKPGEKNPKELIKTAFDQAEGDVSEGAIDEILANKSDIVLGTNIASLTSDKNPQMAVLAKDKKEKLRHLVDGCYSETTVKFESGAVVFEGKNYMSDELKAKMFFKSDANASIIQKLGSGTPKVGLSINLDMKKLQALMEEFSPGMIKTLGENLGGPAQLALMMGGDDALSSILTGEVGVVVLGEPKKDMSVVPDLNFYVGFGPKGKAIGDLAKSFLSHGTLNIAVDEKGLSGATNKAFMTPGGMNIPSGFEMFGKKGITGFVNFEGIDMNSFELEGEAKLLLLVKNVTFEVDNDGGKLVVRAKNGQENVLKQSVQLLLKELEANIANLGV